MQAWAPLHSTAGTAHLREHARRAQHDEVPARARERHVQSRAV
jgi:hypothetical protein